MAKGRRGALLGEVQEEGSVDALRHLDFAARD
jgi:hypothetical protein